MTFDPKTKDFKWVEETEIKNAFGAKITVKPMSPGTDYDNVSDERMKEGCRFYDTSGGRIMSELEIKRWLMGNGKEKGNFMEAYHDFSKIQKMS